MCDASRFDGVEMLPVLESLAMWLARHVGLVRSLSIQMPSGGGVPKQHLASCLSRCLAAGQLESLTLEVSIMGTLHVKAWAAELVHLHTLKLVNTIGRVQLVGSLHQLTALRRLHLRSGPGGVEWQQGVQLPPALTELALDVGSSRSLPWLAQASCNRLHGTGRLLLDCAAWRGRRASHFPYCPLALQLSSASTLRTLELRRSTCGTDGFAVLPSLLSLRRLILDSCLHLPTSISRLAGLEELVLHDSSFGDGDGEPLGAALDAVLRPLTQLTSL